MQHISPQIRQAVKRKENLLQINYRVYMYIYIPSQTESVKLGECVERLNKIREVVGSNWL